MEWSPPQLHCSTLMIEPTNIQAMECHCITDSELSPHGELSIYISAKLSSVLQ